MIKILHSADWHLDAPMSGHSPEGTDYLRRELKRIPEKIVRLAKAEQCDLILLAGDLFDGAYTGDTLRTVQQALAKAGMPVVICAGNHDPIGPSSPYGMEGWPENVHIFQAAKVESIVIDSLDCRIYGASYEAMDCPALLKGFQASGTEKWQVGVFHAEAEVSDSPYCPISRDQVKNSGLSYLALGHIHKGSSFRAGQTLCAWPGCPMGKGYDELGAKGVILVTLSEEVNAAFLPLDTPRFYDEEVETGSDARESVSAIVPALRTEDFYRITLTGYSAGVDLKQLYAAFPHLPNLVLRDETRPELDLWSAVGEDTLEGVYFGLLQQASQSDSEQVAQRAKLAARISRQILDGQEVKLP